MYQSILLKVGHHSGHIKYERSDGVTKGRRDEET